MIKKNLLDITDDDLVMAIRKERHYPDRYREVTKAFWKKYNNYGFNYLRKNFSILSQDDCMDLSTDAVEKMYLKILDGGYQPRLSARSQTYFITICHNAALDYLKSRKKWQPLTVSDDGLEDISLEEDTDLEWEVDKMLRQLEGIKGSEKCLDLVKQKYLHGMSHQELAAVLEITEQSSKNSVSRCLKKIRRAILASNKYIKKFIKK